MEEARLMQLVQELKTKLRQENIRLLNGEQYEQAQEATQLIRDFSLFEERISNLLAPEPRLAEPPRTHESVAVPKRDYPFFRLEGSTVVRVGLRRDKETTYEQRLPKRDLLKVLEPLSSLAETGEAFEAKTAVAEAQAPAYQVYLVLGLLQELGYMENPRRGAYLCHDGGVPHAEAILEELANRKA